MMKYLYKDLQICFPKKANNVSLKRQVFSTNIFYRDLHQNETETNMQNHQRLRMLDT